MKVRTIAGWGCAGLALLAEAALAWGDHETRSGGRTVVADTLGRADWLGGVVLVGAWRRASCSAAAWCGSRRRPAWPCSPPWRCRWERWGC
ncbi:hypothetical protein [Kitasatospora phosalacinea]|uniref:Uncharacterized protein n=1 Tax=Kitasatospora phosalacinea TaxID=2065 RepID=A0A9W6PDT5_9ACTN|nr:hypothetical protein [Kitasatospora phosalacinea]GLW54054.1 hypothetical protein Kpho01_20650 [Kitasatospora phosalacinea]